MYQTKHYQFPTVPADLSEEDTQELSLECRYELLKVERWQRWQYNKYGRDFINYVTSLESDEL